MSKLSDDDLNRAMAGACGWIPAVYKHGDEWYYVRPEEIGRGWTPKPDDATPASVDAARHPDYCHDRNALPAVYAALEAAGATESYFRHLRRLLDHCRTEVLYGQAWAAETAEPKLKVEAALRALDLWKPEWSEGE